MPDIDNLSIQISAESKSAEKSLNSLIKTLERMQKKLGATGKSTSKGFNTLNKSLNSTNATVKKLENNMRKIQRGINSSNVSVKSFNASFVKLYGTLRLVETAFKSITKAVKSSVDYIETYNYFNAALEQVVSRADLTAYKELGFESAEVYAESFAERAKELTAKMTGFAVTEGGLLEATGGNSLGLNPSNVMKYQAMFAQMASSMGIASETSILMSDALTRLGADLASVKNMDFDKVWTDMASGLAGMSRTLDKYGVNIRNVNLQQKLFDLGINESITALNQNEKALLRTIILLESTEYAWADMSDTINQPANQLRLFNANLENLGRIIGNLFIPIISKVMPVLNGFVIALQRTFTTLGSMMGVDLSGITSGTGDGIEGIIEDFDNLTGSMEEAEDVANSVRKTLRGFDELNTISNNEKDVLGGLSLGGSGLLDEAFLKEYERYSKAWNEAYAKMESDAQKFADKFEEIINIGGISEDMKDFAEAVKDFGEAVKPFTKGFASGFTGFFEALGKIGLDVIAAGLDTLGTAISFFDANDVENVGKVLGTLAGGIVAVTGIANVADKFSKLSKGLGTLGTTLVSNPILGTFALATGILTLIEMSNDTDYDASGVTEFANKIDTLKNSLIGLGEEDTEGFTAASSLQTVYDKWSQIAFKVGELSHEEEGLLKLYGDQIKQYCEGANDYIDENGRAFAGVEEKLKSLIDQTVLYYQVQGAKDYMESLYVLEAEFEIETGNAEKKIDALVEKLQGFNSSLTEETIRSYADGLARGVLDADAILSGKEKQFGIERNFLGLRTEKGRQIYEDVVNAMRDLSVYYPKYDEALGLLEETREKMSSAAENYTQKQIDYNNLIGEGTVEVDKFREAVEKNIAVNGIAGEKFQILGGALDNVSEASKKAAEKAGLPSEPIDNLNTLASEAAKGVLDLEDALKGINDKTFKTTLKVLFETPKLDFSTLIPNSVQGILGGLGIKLPQYATGGFPEDGLFMANHGELVGQFSNGKTAVANNAQIIAGIEEAAYRGFMRAMSASGGSNNVTFRVEGDAAGIFKVVQEQANEYGRRTGRGAFYY